MTVQAVTPGGTFSLITLGKGGNTQILPAANTRLEIVWLSLSYTSSAVAGTRYAQIALTRIDTIVTTLVSLSIAASLTVVGNLGLTGPAGAVVNVTHFPTAWSGDCLTLFGNQSLGVVIGGAVDGGDTWAAEGVMRSLPIQTP